MSDARVEIIEQTVRVEVRTHEPDPRQSPPWNWGDILAGRITQSSLRNSRWSDLVNEG